MFPVWAIYSPDSIAQIHIIDPDATKPIFIDSTITIRWTGADNATVALWYSSNHGIQWNLIAGNITTDHYDWVVPELPTDSLLFRVEAQKGIDPYPILTILNAHQQEVRYARFSSDGSLILSAGRDGWIKVWNSVSGKAIDSLLVPDPAQIYQAQFFHSTDSVLVTQGRDILLWNRSARQASLLGLVGHTDFIRCIAVHPSLSVFATGGADSTLRFWNMGVSASQKTYTAATDIYTTTFSGDGSLIAFAGDNGNMYVHQWETTLPQIVLRQHGNNGQNLVVWGCGFSPDGTHLVSCGVDKTVRIWNRQKGQVDSILTGHTFHVRSVVYSSDGRRILSGSLDSTLRQWNAETYTQIGQPLNHGGQVLAIDYSPTGDTLLSTGRDRAIRLWKSGRSETSTDTIVYALRRPVILEIPDLIGHVGRGLYVPLIWHNRQFIQGSDTARFIATIALPSTLLSVMSNSGLQALRVDGMTDTVRVSATIQPGNDTVAMIPTYVLLGFPPHQGIFIRRVEWLNGAQFVAQTVDGSVTLLDSCGSITKRVVGFTEKVGILSITPNPSSHYLRIDYALPSDDPARLRLFNAQGGEVRLLADGISGAGEYFTEAQVSSLPSGEYFLILENGYRRYTQKFLIMR